MKVSTGLSLAALGAILAFAVHGHPPYVNLNAVGWVLMIVGIAGIFAPPGSRSWLRTRLVMRDGRYRPVAEDPGEHYSGELISSGLLPPGEEAAAFDGTLIEEDVVEE
jgi:hypothetical protein